METAWQIEPRPWNDARSRVLGEGFVIRVVLGLGDGAGGGKEGGVRGGGGGKQRHGWLPKDNEVISCA